MGTGGGAPVGVVTELMDVHATLSIGVIASDIPCDGGWGGLRFLLEGNSAGDLRVTSNGCDYTEEEQISIGRDTHRVMSSKSLNWNMVLGGWSF